MPQVSDILDTSQYAKYISRLNAKSAYWRDPVAEAFGDATTFPVSNRGLFQFWRIPFGFKSAPATWIRQLGNALGYNLEPNVFAYLDGVIVTETFEQHLSILDEVFKRLREANIVVSDKYCKPELIYFGYKIDRKRLHVNHQRRRQSLSYLTRLVCLKPVE